MEKVKWESKKRKSHYYSHVRSQPIDLYSHCIPWLCKGEGRAGIAHNDIKGTNMLLDYENRVCVSDFGIAHVISNTAVAGRIEAQEHGLSIPYASRELLQMFILKTSPTSIEPAQSFAADIYAFSMTMYEVIELKTPWTGMLQKEIIAQVLQGASPELASVESFSAGSEEERDQLSLIQTIYMVKDILSNLN